MRLPARSTQEPALDPAALAEDVDLSLDVRREILALDARLGRMTHHELLGVARGAAVETVRASYLERVKRFHPDRYAGKRLGSFRARLDRITRQLTQARDVLCDPVLRVDYERRTATPDEVARLHVQRIEDEARAEERRARLGRTNPLLARAARFADLVKRGKEHLSAGRADRAANDFATALALDPNHAEVKALAEEARRRAAAARAEEAWVEANAAEASGRDVLALDRFSQVLAANPCHSLAALSAVRAALRLGRAPQARQIAEAAVRAAPGSAVAQLALAEALLAGDDKGAARKALQRAVELDPQREEAKAMLRKLRWSLFR